MDLVEKLEKRAKELHPWGEDYEGRVIYDHGIADHRELLEQAARVLRQHEGARAMNKPAAGTLHV